jgi:hypothetical protein
MIVRTRTVTAASAGSSEPIRARDRNNRCESRRCDLELELPVVAFRAVIRLEFVAPDGREYRGLGDGFADDAVAACQWRQVAVITMRAFRSRPSRSGH